jgi:electron transfer flavoprotein beta subunit
MDIAVLISGVADPKWPLPHELSVASLQIHAARYAALSPFDEAALELALALRDANPDIRITTLVAADDALTRRVAGWRPDTVCRVDLETIARWDGAAVAVALAQALRERAPEASLVLVGREFGDYDDGSVPAALALALEMTYVPLALNVRRQAEGFAALRQGPGALERVQLSAPVLLGATNDPGNRLRHPLMKNVMLSKKAVFEVLQAASSAPCGVLRLDTVAPAQAPVRRADCEWLEGSPEQKARALAQVLMAAAAT